jgi:hypothetical protein
MTFTKIKKGYQDFLIATFLIFKFDLYFCSAVVIFSRIRADLPVLERK